MDEISAQVEQLAVDEPSTLGASGSGNEFVEPVTLPDDVWTKVALFNRCISTTRYQMSDVFCSNLVLASYKCYNSPLTQSQVFQFVDASSMFSAVRPTNKSYDHMQTKRTFTCKYTSLQQKTTPLFYQEIFVSF